MKGALKHPTIGLLESPYAARLPFRGMNGHKPTLRVGPLLPHTWERAKAWLRNLPKLRVGFRHYLEKGEEGAILVREQGRKESLLALVPPKEWKADATKTS
jgi:hypothetical protein